jgi:hypothetical protein
MYRRALIVGLVTLPWVGISYAAGWTLITEEEFKRDGAAPRFRGGVIVPTEPSGAPIIEVDQPDQTNAIRVPVNIRIRFRPQGGAVIDLATFRATYGWLGIDITSRIIEHAQINASGLFANNAEMPAGHHKVTLQIADNVRRVGSRVFEFTVV